jgi:hypothetical protein
MPDDDGAAAARARARREAISRLSGKLHAALWVVAAALVWRYGRVWEELVWPAPHVGSGGVSAWALRLGAALACASAGIGLYLVVWLGCIARVDLAWDVAAPRAVPAASAAGVAALLCFLVGMWPAFGLLTPLVLATLTMGALMLAHFIPSP